MRLRLVLEDSRSHDSGHGAAEADEHRDEALAVQADLVHDLVHNEGGPGHVAGVLQESNRQKQQKDVRQKDQHTADTAEDAVNDQRMQRPRLTRPYGGHHPGGKSKKSLQPPHGIFAGREGKLENKIHQHDEDRQAQYGMGQDGVSLVRHVVPQFDAALNGFLAGAEMEP